MAESHNFYQSIDFKLISLKIKNFKNLKDISIDFKNNENLTIIFLKGLVLYLQKYILEKDI